MVAFATRIGGVALAAGLGLSGAPTQAGYVVDLTQQGGNVVATGSGEIDLTGLDIISELSLNPFVNSSLGSIVTGPDAVLPAYIYGGTTLTGPTSFGSLTPIATAGGSGKIVGVAGHGELVAGLGILVPDGYVTDSPLSSTATWDGYTFSTLRLTPGTYEWTWGTGANQNFTLVIGTPEPSTWAMMLLGFAGLGFAGYRRTRKALST